MSLDIVRNMVFAYLKKTSKLTIVPTKDCFFVKVRVPPRVKVTREFVTLNYGAESPFTAYQLVYLMEREQLYIWFIRETIVGDESKCNIPASLLFAKSTIGQKDGTLFVVSSEDGAEVIAAKDGTLLGQYVISGWHKNKKRQIQLISKEHNLTQPVIHNLSLEESDGIHEKGLRQIVLLSLPGFWLAKNSGEVLWKNYLAQLLPVVVLCLVVSSVVKIYAIWSLEQKVDKLKNDTVVVRQKVKPLLASQNTYLNSEKYWTEFAESEVRLASQVPVYLSIVSTIGEVGGQLKRWDGSKGGARFVVLTESATHLLDTLRKQGGNYSIKIDGAVVKDKKSEMDKASFKATFFSMK